MILARTGSIESIIRSKAEWVRGYFMASGVISFMSPIPGYSSLPNGFWPPAAPFSKKGPGV